MMLIWLIGLTHIIGMSIVKLSVNIVKGTVIRGICFN